MPHYSSKNLLWVKLLPLIKSWAGNIQLSAEEMSREQLQTAKLPEQLRAECEWSPYWHYRSWGSVTTGSYAACLRFPCSLWLPWGKPSTFAGVDLLFPSSLSSDTCQKPQLRLQETVTVKSLLLEIKTATDMVTILWSNSERNVIQFGYHDLSFCGFS